MNAPQFDCKHDWNGPLYYVTRSGKIITYKTHSEWIGYVDSFRAQLVHFKYDLIHDDPIIESGSTCSHCGCSVIVPYLFF
jgi:hypothetical protein